MQQYDCDFSMMKNLGSYYNFKVLDSEDVSENQHDNDFDSVLRQIEKDLMSDKLPLLIRTPNGRNDAGQKRDCFILNPDVKKAA